MSDFFEKKQNELEQPLVDENVNEDASSVIDEEESTVFSAPKEHKPKNNFALGVILGTVLGKLFPHLVISSMAVKLISAFLAVAILVGGTFAIIKLVPEITDEEVESTFETISVIKADSETFDSVTVKNEHGDFKFVLQKIITGENNTATNTYWTIEGVDHSKLSESKVSSVINSAAEVTATLEVDKKVEECGFEKPLVKVSVVSTDESYTFIVGDKSPDGFGHYFTVEGSNKVYVVGYDAFSDFEFSLLDVSNTSSIEATVFESDTSSNKEADGSYAYFDSLKISGKLFPEMITIINNPDDSETAGLTPYIITTPTKRYADSTSLSSPVALFSSTTAIDGNYALDITDETLKLFGLDNPDAIITMTINGESKTFKFALVDESYCAIVYDGATMIRKAYISSFDFLSFKPEDFYYKSLFMNSINDITGLILTDNDGEVKFDIYDKEDSDSGSTYTACVGDKNVTKGFYGYYNDFVNIQCSNFEVVKVSGKPNCTIRFTFHKGEDKVVEFYKVSETAYQYRIDGIDMGKITSSAYNKMIKNLRTIADGGTVN
ncbi:MAG: DUF4340 domain-containing protein [Clostridia bacterium]|nr:DUF4340 domain-containing protein [Clostridia bacterium]